MQQDVDVGEAQARRLSAPSRRLHEHLNASARVLRVTAKDCGAGFFAFLCYAINQFIWAESNSFTPVVEFGERCRDGRVNRYYDALHGPNIWDYFFWPASSAVARPGDFQLSPKQLFWQHHLSDASVQTYPHGLYRHLKVPHWHYDEPWHRMMRGRADRMLRRHVRLRAAPVRAVRAFYRDVVLSRGEHRPVLGVHLRGTDKIRNVGGRIVRPDEYRPLIRSYLRQRPDALLLLATDSPSFLRELSSEYGDRVVYYDALRSERNAFLDRRVGNNYKKGEDALVDALALSCANFLVKPASALSEFAVYWNTELHNHTYEIQYETGLPSSEAALEAHLASPRDRIRGWARCAEAVRTEV
jgi:hypothetical protein